MLLFGSERWVMTPHMGRALGSLQNRVARQITGIQPKKREEGGWEYPPLVAGMEDAVFDEIRANILKRQNMVAQCIALRPILDLCKKNVQRPGAWVAWRWWEQEGIDIAGTRARAATAEDGEEERSGEEMKR